MDILSEKKLFATFHIRNAFAPAVSLSYAQDDDNSSVFFSFCVHSFLRFDLLPLQDKRESTCGISPTNVAGLAMTFFSYDKKHPAVAYREEVQHHYSFTPEVIDPMRSTRAAYRRSALEFYLGRNVALQNSPKITIHSMIYPNESVSEESTSFLFPLRTMGVKTDAPIFDEEQAYWMRKSPVVMHRMWMALEMMMHFYGVELCMSLEEDSTGTSSISVGEEVLRVLPTPQEHPESTLPRTAATLTDGEDPRYISRYTSVLLPVAEGQAVPWNEGDDKSWVLVRVNVKGWSDKQFREDRQWNLVNNPHNCLRITRILQFLGEMHLGDLKMALTVFLAQEIARGGILDGCRRSLEDFWVETLFHSDDRKFVRKILVKSHSEKEEKEKCCVLRLPRTVLENRTLAPSWDVHCRMMWSVHDNIVLYLKFILIYIFSYVSLSSHLYLNVAVEVVSLKSFFGKEGSKSESDYFPFVEQMFRFSRGFLAAVSLTAADIEAKLLASATLQPTAVSVLDTSAGCGSFFKIRVVSPVFSGKPLIQQHRLVNEVLKDEIRIIHGFTLETKAKECLVRGCVSNRISSPRILVFYFFCEMMIEEREAVPSDALNDDGAEIKESTIEDADEADEEASSNIHFFDDLEACEALIRELSGLLLVDPTAEEGIAKDRSKQLSESKNPFALHLLPTASEDPTGAAAKVDQLAKLLDRYQELPHLLHPHLEQMVHPLIRILLRFVPCATVIWEWERIPQRSQGGMRCSDAKEEPGGNPCNQMPGDADDAFIVSNRLGQNFDQFDPDAPKEPLHLVSRALYHITKTAGVKACTSHFPNDVRHFEDVYYTLRWWATSPLRQREWEVRYCLLVWLSNLVLVPFSIHLIDTHAVAPIAPQPVEARLKSESNIEYSSSMTQVIPSGQRRAVPLSDAALITAVTFLADPTKCQEGAALLVARLLTRPDSKRHRDVFFRFVNDVVRCVPAQKRCPGFLWDGVLESLAMRKDTAPFNAGSENEDTALCHKLLPGVLLAVAKTMKMAQRHEVVRYAEALVEHIVEDLWEKMHESKTGGGGDTLLLKLCAKVVQRLMLSMLKKRRAMWKYHRTTLTSLADNLGGATDTGSMPDHPQHDGDEEVDDDEEIDGDENVLELGTGLLLEALSQKDTIVRWSAAKGIGRICERLPAAMAAEIVSAVLNLLSDDDYNDSVWHGCMLAIAELCRRGLLVKERLIQDAVPLIEKGLCYDVAKGTYSVGAHVRDAAAYTCWSMARAYDPNDILPQVHRLSGALVVTSLFDRQVNVRRAASAAFQECVGRLGNFPHGIELSTTMDFFALSSTASAYLRVAPVVAKFDTYRGRMIETLVAEKLVHWDRALRSMAAGALGRIAQLEPEMMRSDVFPELIRRVTDSMVATRHGAILGLAELVRHMQPVSWWTPEMIRDLASVFTRLDAERLFRSRGGEYVRDACCQLLEAMATHPLPLPEVLEITRLNGTKGKVKTLGKLQEFFEDSWSNILDWMQIKATTAFLRFAKAYYTSFQPSFHGKVLHKMLSALADASVPLLQRKGFIAALGCVPAPLLIATPPAASLAEAEADEKAKENVAPEPYLVVILQELQKLAFIPGAVITAFDSDAILSDVGAVAETTRADPESRRNAVNSLTQVLIEIPLGHPAFTPERYANAVQTLLMALQDYATDNRGDVGSYVRLAVLKHIADVTLRGLHPNAALCTPSLALAVLQGLLRVLFEKMDKVREAAGSALQQLLLSKEGEQRVVQGLWPTDSAQSREVSLLRDVVRRQQQRAEAAPGPLITNVLLAELLEGAQGSGDGEKEDSMHWGSPGLMQYLGPPLLQHAPMVFAQSVADGLVVSAGDLTDHVRGPALCAIRQAFHLAGSTASELSLDATAGEESVAECRQRLSQIFVGVGHRYPHAERMVVPLCRLLDFLLTQEQGALPLADHVAIVSLLRSEMKHFSGSIRTLLPMVTLLASLCRSPSQQAREQAWALALIMIASRYPKVRATMATELYTALLSVTSSIQQQRHKTGAEAAGMEGSISLDGCLTAMEHITKTQWDGTDAGKVRAARNQLYDMLHLQRPPPTAGGGAEEMKEKKVKREVVASTYSALVQEAGY
eukprot:gene3862-2739_t